MLAFVVVLQSCKKKDEEPVPTAPTTNTQSGGSNCSVATERLESNDPDFPSKDLRIYTYDSNNKLISFQKASLWFDGVEETTQVQYGSNSITHQKHDANNNLINTEIATLNSSGYVSGSTSVGIDTINVNGINTAYTSRDTATYLYDGNWFLTKEIHRKHYYEIPSGNWDKTVNDTITFVIQGENITSVTQKMVTNSMFNGFPSISSQEGTATYTYDANLNKSGQTVDSWGNPSIDPFNIKGKKSKYLVETAATTGNSPDTYTYVLNSGGFVVGQTGGWFPVSYTYSCHQ